MHPLRSRLPHLGSLVLALLAAVALVASAPHTARAAVMLAPSDARPKDFAFIKKDGVYHLFYIRHNDFLPAWATELDFGHAVSTDLYHWTQLPPVMGVDPFGWDNLHVWAPHIVEHEGLYWMFYTGVTEARNGLADVQSIGLAVSSDLMTWNRVASQPVWSLQGAPWAWWRPTNGAMACRDPFVMPDPARPGEWLMYYTASPASDTASTLIGVARSNSNDLALWQDEKPLWITHRSWSFNLLTESPHLFQHNGRWFLMITANAGQPLSFFTTNNPLGEPLEWIYRGRLRNMLGFDTSLWFASEVLVDGEHDLFAFCSGDRIEIRRIVWGTGDNFSFAEPAFCHVTSMEWSRSSVREHDLVGLRLFATNGFAFDRKLEAYVRDANGVEQLVPLDSLALPQRPLPFRDTMLVRWYARRWPAGGDPAAPMRLRVALDDGTASSDWLTVSPSPLEVPVGTGPGGIDPVEPVEELPPPPPPFPQEDTVVVTHGPAGGDAALRVVPGAPVAGTALALELAEAAPARAEVFDLQGRRLAVLADRTLPRGANVLTWDGRDATGAAAPRGLYFVRVRLPDRVLTARILRER